jgi:hypothetical protein
MRVTSSILRILQWQYVPQLVFFQLFPEFAKMKNMKLKPLFPLINHLSVKCQSGSKLGVTHRKTVTKPHFTGEAPTITGPPNRKFVELSR